MTDPRDWQSGRLKRFAPVVDPRLRTLPRPVLAAPAVDQRSDGPADIHVEQPPRALEFGPGQAHRRGLAFAGVRDIASFGAIGHRLHFRGSIRAGESDLVLERGSGTAKPGLSPPRDPMELWRPGAGVGVGGARRNGASLRGRVESVDLAGYRLRLQRPAEADAKSVDVWSDDGPPLQEALDQAAGGPYAYHVDGHPMPTPIHLPAGTYVIGVPLAEDNRPLFLFSHTDLVGDGPARTVLLPADEANQPVWDPRVGPAASVALPGAGRVVVLTNSRSTSWSRDSRQRRYESVEEHRLLGGQVDDPGWPGPPGGGMVDLPGPVDPSQEPHRVPVKTARANENLRIRSLTVDGNRDRQRLLYRGGGSSRLWGEIDRPLSEALPEDSELAAQPKTLAERVPGYYRGDQGVAFELLDYNGRPQGTSPPVVQRLYLILTLLDQAGVESTASRLGQIDIYDRPRTRLTWGRC